MGNEQLVKTIYLTEKDRGWKAEKRRFFFGIFVLSLSYPFLKLKTGKVPSAHCTSYWCQLSGFAHVQVYVSLDGKEMAPFPITEMGGFTQKDFLLANGAEKHGKREFKVEKIEGAYCFSRRSSLVGRPLFVQAFRGWICSGPFRWSLFFGWGNCDFFGTPVWVDLSWPWSHR